MHADNSAESYNSCLQVTCMITGKTFNEKCNSHLSQHRHQSQPVNRQSQIVL